MKLEPGIDITKVENGIIYTSKPTPAGGVSFFIHDEDIENGTIEYVEQNPGAWVVVGDFVNDPYYIRRAQSSERQGGPSTVLQP